MSKAISKTANTHTRASSYKSRMPNSKVIKIVDNVLVINRRVYEKQMDEQATFQRANELKLFAFYRTWFRGMLLADMPVLDIAEIKHIDDADFGQIVKAQAEKRKRNRKGWNRRNGNRIERP